MKANLFSGNLNARELLDYYLKNSPPSVLDDLKVFKGLTDIDKQDVLFLMLSHLNIAVVSTLMLDSDHKDETSH